MHTTRDIHGIHSSRQSQRLEGKSVAIAPGIGTATGYGKLLPFPPPHIQHRRPPLKRRASPLAAETTSAVVVAADGTNLDGAADAIVWRKGVGSLTEVQRRLYLVAPLLPPVGFREMQGNSRSPLQKQKGVDAQWNDQLLRERLSFSQDARGSELRSRGLQAKPAHPSTCPQSGRWSTALLLGLYLIIMAFLAQRLALAISWRGSLLVMGTVQLLLAILLLKSGSRPLPSHGLQSGRRGPVLRVTSRMAPPR